MRLASSTHPTHAAKTRSPARMVEKGWAGTARFDVAPWYAHRACTGGPPDPSPRCSVAAGRGGTTGDVGGFGQGRTDAGQPANTISFFARSSCDTTAAPQ